jgi:hypothetical protein
MAKKYDEQRSSATLYEQAKIARHNAEDARTGGDSLAAVRNCQRRADDLEQSAAAQQVRGK